MLRNALIINDVHLPFENKKALELSLQIAEDTGVDEIVLNGDIFDFYWCSSHAKNPHILKHTSIDMLRYEIEYGVSFLRNLRKRFPKAKIVFIEGNHEYRLHRYIMNQADALFNIVSLKELLRLDEFDISYEAYGPYQKYSVMGSSLFARHEPLGGGENVALTSVKKAMCSIIFGHVHKLQESQIVSMDGENYRGISNGWLGNKNSPVMTYVKNHHQWALGFSITTYDTSTLLWHNELVHVLEKGGKVHCKVNGQVYIL